jgi:hypothetical protein
MVAAALLMPHEGSRAKMSMRTAIVYPARAALPNDESMRTRKTQLAMPIRI